MADDVQLQVGIDLESLKTNAQQAAGLLGQAFQGAYQSLVKGNLLGSGLAPTQLPASQNPMLAALQGIHATLLTGFTALTGTQMPTPAGGGPGGAGVPAAPQPPAQPPGGKPGGKQYGFGTGMRALDQLHLPTGAFDMWQHNFDRTSMLGFAEQLTSDIPVLRDITKLISTVSKATDQYQIESLDMFRTGGEAAWKSYGRTTTSDLGQGYMRKLGLSRSDVFDLTRQAAGTGMLDDLGSNMMGNMQPLMNLQGRFGLGGPGIGMMRSMIQGGGSAAGTDTMFANTLALAIATNLDRGRWGEAFGAMTKAAQAITTGDVSGEKLLGLNQYVGSMGGRFKGDTTSAGSMRSMLMGMTGGQGGGLSEIYALQAAGLGEGDTTYAQAWLKMKEGFGAEGNDLERVLDRYKNFPSVREYVSAIVDDPALLAQATFDLSIMPGMQQYKPTDIKALLRRMREGGVGGIAKKYREEGARRLRGEKLPGTALQRQVDRVVEPSLTGVKGNQAEAAIDRSNKRIDDATGGGFWSDLIKGTGAGVVGGFFERGVDPQDRDSVGDPGGGVDGGTSQGFMDQYTTKQGRFGVKRPDAPQGHPGVDVEVNPKFPPGSAVYSPVSGTVIGTTIKPPGDEVGYWISIARVGDGKRIIIGHIDPTTVNKALGAGQPIKKGTFIGRIYSSAKFSSGRAMHTHIGVKPPAGQGDEPLDPSKELNLEDVTHPDTAAGGAQSSAAGGGSGPVSQRVDIYVHDSRVSVTKSAANRTRPGQPGQQFNNGKRNG